MGMLLTILGIVAGFVVLIEGCNKLERTDVRAARTRAEWWSALLRAVGWSCLVLAAAGAFFLEALPPAYLKIGYVLAVVGCACMVIRSRVREFIPRTAPGPAPEAFDRTQAMMSRT